MSVPETPYTRGEMYLSAIADGDSGGIPERPYTRKEMYLDAIARGDSSGIPERPYTREEMYLDAIAKNGGGGGGSTLIDKNVSANGTYNASSDSADGYKKVVVNVPNSYAAGDEGKVVSNGALVSQTAHAEVTANGTIDTTLNDSVVVNVRGGGGGSNWKLMATQEYTVNTSSTTATDVGSIELPLADYANTNIIVWVHIRDKAGKRTGYFYGSDSFYLPYTIANGGEGNTNIAGKEAISIVSSGNYEVNTGSYGVYPHNIGYTALLSSLGIKSRYNSSYGIINGTYKVDVYALTTPSGMTLFD